MNPLLTKLPLLLCMLVFLSRCQPSCSQSQILNTNSLTCVDCPSGMRPNPQQKIATSCVCNAGYFPSGSLSCQYFGTNSNLCASNQFFLVHNTAAVYSSLSSTYSCVACSDNAYANMYLCYYPSNGTGCVPCHRNMKYSANEKICICADPTIDILTLQGCFSPSQTSSTSSLAASNSKYYEHLKYVLNLLFSSCLLVLILMTNFLAHFQQTYALIQLALDNHPSHNLSSFQYYHQINPNIDKFYISPGKFTKNQQLKFKIMYFLPTGNFVKQKEMRLPDILRCGMPADNSATIKLGNNIQVTCTFDFDYLIAKLETKTYVNYLYEIYLSGQNNNYFPVDVYIGSSSTPIKRFFLEDTFTSKTSVNVLTSLKMSIFLNSTGFLHSPKLQVGYTKLSYTNGKITPTTDKSKSIAYQIKFSYELTTFWPAFIGIFIAINVLVLIQSIIRTYIAHLNRQSILRFFYFFANFWSIWMFYFLIGVSGYWFLFGKTTQDVYIFIPDSGSDIFYVAFYIIAGLMGLFRVITVIYDKMDKLNYQIFMINWEKGKNSWRQIFIINSLAQFYTYRTVSFFWAMLWLLFFLVGLNWQTHAAQVAHTTISQVFYFNPTNRVFLYFLGATTFLVIGIVFKILRRISVIFWPYPFENFVDYCNVTNISFFFMKKRSPEAYYIHASIPQRTQVTFKEINEAIRRGLNKERNFLKEHSFHDSQRMYIIYICKDLQEKFNNMIKRCQDEQHQKSLKHAQKYQQSKKKSKQANPREQFIQKKLKPYLESIQRTTSNRTKSFCNRLFGKPEIDLRDESMPRNRNEVIYDDNLDLVSQVFPNGNEFQQIHTIIILFLMFLLATNNVCAAALIAYFVDEFIICRWWIQGVSKRNLQKMTKVKQGFMQ